MSSSGPLGNIVRNVGINEEIRESLSVSDASSKCL